MDNDQRCRNATAIQILSIGVDRALQLDLAGYHDAALHVVPVYGLHDAIRQLPEADLAAAIISQQPGRLDHLDLLRGIRSQSRIPIIVVSDRSDEVDRVIALELGADDYMTKPLHLGELVARIRAILRRHQGGSAERPSNALRGRYRFGDWEFDKQMRFLMRRGVAPVKLTHGEHALLCAFVDAPQRPLSRDYLLQVTLAHEDVCDRSIDVQVMRLRRKLKSHANAASIIRTDPGVGYVFSAAVESLD